MVTYLRFRRFALACAHIADCRRKIYHRPYTLQMYDVGGQRNERKKWIHCFDTVTAVIFVAAIGEYDQVLYEDHSANRIQEALALFEEICNSRWFEDTSIILFLNKRDLFEEKIAKKTMESMEMWKDCTAGNDPTKGIEYLKKRFLAPNKTPKDVYATATCATDTKNVEFVFNSCEYNIEKKLTRRWINVASLSIQWIGAQSSCTGITRSGSLNRRIRYQLLYVST